MQHRGSTMNRILTWQLQVVARTSMGFIMLRLAWVVRQQNPAECFSKIPGFNLWKLSRLSGVFPPFGGHFFKRVREPEVKLRHLVYEVWLVSYLFFSFQIWYFRKWIITSIGQSKHLRVILFNPLGVSAYAYGLRLCASEIQASGSQTGIGLHVTPNSLESLSAVSKLLHSRLRPCCISSPTWL